MAYTKEQMREYMRKYRDEHPEYCKRNSEKCAENQKADPEKWRAYRREYYRKYRR